MKVNPHITGWDADSPCKRGHTDGRYHDCAYVEDVERLLPEAERLTEMRVRDHVEEHGKITDVQEYRLLYSRIFFEESQSLCEVEGLRRAGPRD